MTEAPTSVYLSLGSNVGDRLENLRRACLTLEARGIGIRRASAVYETEPVDVREQAWFLNCAVEVETTLPPARLLEELQQIERELGRERLRPKGPQAKSPRTIDLDILLYGDSVIHTDYLLVPHPRLHERRFVLEPLRELAPSLRVPLLHRTVEQLLRELRDPSEVRQLSDPLLLPKAR
ncbi:MAG: 2-amino-4-hydroxy-6-hydroxymethyldihydropteridine diphosphokinase [Acidobacteria bacterium RIFCSPLOWO2_02_FULL_61_28]|nr:MAG: 2-amino-4-hydroxy-6-hydroxymethyldihydropteridine diphosphokinase [Acidobacteria bacterium RIFCSPLOWO2_02_FULL_61_28]